MLLVTDHSCRARTAPRSRAPLPVFPLGGVRDRPSVPSLYRPAECNATLDAHWRKLARFGETRLSVFALVLTGSGCVTNETD